MRKAIAILLVLVMLCSACIIAAHAAVNTQRDQVVISENVIYGNRMAADGLNIVRRADWDERLHWTTDYNIGSENKYDTEFKFTQSREYERYSGRPDAGGITFSRNVGGGMSSSHEITREKLSDIFSGFEDICLAVMERAPAGMEYRETLKLKDYYEFHPLNINVHLPELYYVHRYSDDPVREYVRPMEGDYCSEINEALSSFFKIPVTENDMAEINVYKEASGIVTEVDLNTYVFLEDEYSGGDFWVNSVVIQEKGAYMVFDCGDDIDFSNIPGGCGIYCMPFGASFEFDGSTYPTVDYEGLSMVYPLDKNTKIESFFYDEQQDRLVLITVENGGYVFTSINPDTMETVQSFDITACEDGDVYDVCQYEDFIVLYLSVEKFAVINNCGNGNYELDYVVDRCPENDEELFWYNSSSVMAYDGERLAVAWDREREEPPYADCGFYIAIYDKTGLLYFGDYESGLMTGRYNGSYGYYCAPASGANLELKWQLA